MNFANLVWVLVAVLHTFRKVSLDLSFPNQVPVPVYLLYSAATELLTVCHFNTISTFKQMHLSEEQSHVKTVTTSQLRKQKVIPPWLGLSVGT